MERGCYEEEVQPYRKMDYKPIIIINTLKISSLFYQLCKLVWVMIRDWNLEDVVQRLIWAILI